MLGSLDDISAAQNLNWRWTYRLQLIWVFCELVALILVSRIYCNRISRLTSAYSLYQKHMCPSFYNGRLEGVYLLVRVANFYADYTFRIRKTTGKRNYYAPFDVNDTNLLNAIIISCYKPFRM